MQKLTPQEALIYIMVTTSAANATLTINQLQSINDIVSHYPVFNGFDFDRLDALAAECYTYLEEPDGLERILDTAHSALPEKLQETAFALAVEVAASDLNVKQEELMFLQLLSDHWNLDELTVAVLKHSARIRFRKHHTATAEGKFA